jgi:hypothetical protein
VKRKERPIEEHSDAEVLTLIALGHTRINELARQQDEIREDIKKWRKVMRERKRVNGKSAPAHSNVRKVLFPPAHLKTSVPRSAIRAAVKKVVSERG